MIGMIGRKNMIGVWSTALSGRIKKKRRVPYLLNAPSSETLLKRTYLLTPQATLAPPPPSGAG